MLSTVLIVLVAVVHVSECFQVNTTDTSTTTGVSILQFPVEVILAHVRSHYPRSYPSAIVISITPQQQRVFMSFEASFSYNILFFVPSLDALSSIKLRACAFDFNGTSLNCLKAFSPNSPYVYGDFGKLKRSGQVKYQLEVAFTAQQDVPSVGAFYCGSSNSTFYTTVCNPGVTDQRLHAVALRNSTPKSREKSSKGEQQSAGFVSAGFNMQFSADRLANNFQVGIAAVKAEAPEGIGFCFSTIDSFSTVDLNVQRCIQDKFLDPNSTKCDIPVAKRAAGFGGGWSIPSSSDYAFYEAKFSQIRPNTLSASFIGWGPSFDSICKLGGI